MTFRVPTFNLTCKVWSSTVPPPGLPRLTGVPCNLAWGRRVAIAVGAGAGTTAVEMTVLFPKGTDLRTQYQGVGDDIIEVPSGSGRYYQVGGVDDVGKGFPNEHRAAVISPTTAGGFWPIPMP